MARLPQPGGDSGNWGDILNDYLSQSHKADGSIKDNVIGSAQFQDNSVTSAKIAPGSVTTVALAPDSVNATTIADASVSSQKLASDAVAKAHLSPALRTEFDDKLGSVVASSLYETAKSPRSLALRKFYSALADRANSPVDILTIGDSRTEGQGATVVGDRWQDRLLAALRLRYSVLGVTGGRGYIPAWYAFTVPSPTGAGFTPSGSVTQSQTFGLGRRSVTLAASGTLTITVTCSSFDLIYAVSASASSVTVTIDGGAADLVSIGAGNLGGQFKHYTTSVGTHTIVITHASGAPIVEGIMVYNGDESKGLRLHDGSHFGFTSGSFVSNGSWAQSVTPAAPDLAIICLGTNDVGAGAVPAATFKTNLSTIITSIRARAAECPVVIVAPSERGDTYTPVEPWANYVIAMREVATVTSGAIFFDMASRQVKANLDTYGAFQADKIHESSLGYGLVADALTGFLEA